MQKGGQERNKIFHYHLYPIEAGSPPCLFYGTNKGFVTYCPYDKGSDLGANYK